jgi:hypothetical protein
MSKRNLIIIAVAIIFGLPLLGFVTSFSKSRQLNSNFGGLQLNSAQEIADDRYAVGSQAQNAQKRVFKEVGPAAPTSVTEMPPSSGEGFTPTEDRTIVKTGTLAMLVKDTRQAVEKVHQIVRDQQGFVTSSNVYESDYSQGIIRAEMTLRVPVDKLDATVSEVKKVAEKITTENLSASDRTEQKIDLEAQLKNLRATEEQLLTIMKQAKTVEETLQVQEEISNVRNRIERMQAQLDNLVGDAAMSTLTISMSTKESELPVVNPGKRTVWEEVKAAARDSVTLYRNLFVAGVRMMILVLPALLIAGVGYKLIKSFQRK